MESKDTELSEFLSAIWGNEEQKVFLAYKSSPTEFSVPKSQEWPASKESIIKWCMAASAQGREVYFSPATYKKEATNKTKESVKGSRVLWVDIDGNADNVYKELAALGLPEPTWRVGTGRNGHEHWYWLTGREMDTETLEGYNKRISYAFNADHCWNADRVLRVPFTRNHMIGKDDPKSYPVDFISKNHNAYELESFEVLPTVKDTVRETISLGEIPSIQEVLAKYRWDEQHYDLFNAPGDVKSRSDAIVRLAYFGAEAGMPDEAIYSVINDFDNRVGKFKGRADRERRLAEIIIKARSKYPFVAIPTFSVDEDTRLVYGVKDLLESEFHIDWLIEDFIPQRTINFISAIPGIGKSRLSMQLALAASRGQDFLKWKIDKPMKTFYLSLEMMGDMLKHFTVGLMQDTEATEEDNERFLLAPVGNAIDMTTEEGFSFLEDLIKEHRPDLMFIDSLGAMVLAELKEKEAKILNSHLKTLISKYGTTFFIIHHNRKLEQGANRRPTLSDIYGSQYVLTEAAVVLAMHMPENQANVELIPLKTRASMAPDPILMTGKAGFQFVLKKDEPNDSTSFDDIS